MSSRQLEDAAERRQAEYIAGALGCTVEALADHPYQLDENASDDGVVYSWRVLWDDTAPPGIATHGSAGSLWSDIPVGG